MGVPALCSLCRYTHTHENKLYALSVFIFFRSSQCIYLTTENEIYICSMYTASDADVYLFEFSTFISVMGSISSLLSLNFISTSILNICHNRLTYTPSVMISINDGKVQNWQKPKKMKIIIIFTNWNSFGGNEQSTIHLKKIRYTSFISCSYHMQKSVNHDYSII